MISKGTTHNNGARLAAYMTVSQDGQRAELWQLRGFEATNIKDAFRDVQIMAGATKADRPFFHVQVRNREGETLTRQQWEHAADRIERMLGLSGQPRAIAFHTYEHNNDEHMHVAWSRIDESTMKAIPLPFFKERLKKISRELELHFGLEPVTNQRKGNIKFAPTRAEDEQARRLGLDPHQLRNTIRECWDRSDCGKSFQAALEHEGFILAQGRRDFVVIDPEGGTHALGKRILDMTASKIRERLSDISRDELPSVEMVRAFLHENGLQEKKQRREKLEPVWDRDRDERAWQNAVIKAAIEKEKIERKYVEPEQRRGRAGGRKEREWPISPPIPEPIRTSPAYHFENAAREAVRPAREPRAERVHQRAKPTRAAIRENATGTKVRAASFAKDNIRRTAFAAGSAVRTIGKTLDFASDAFSSLFAPEITPEQKREGDRMAARREAEAESAIDFSRYTAELARQREQQESARQRERSGRER